MTYATTFSGIGGWELGLNACGWSLQWQCEREPFCRVLLNERFGVPIYDDIRTICEQSPAPVDALIGSPPCQPFSVAGKKGGTGDGRHLYPAFLRAVEFLEPRWVLMEQVPAILSTERGRAFGGYIAGLAALGYDVLWHCIPACAVGANHQRDRIWIMAHSKCGRRREQLRTETARQPVLSTERTEGAFSARPGREDVANAQKPERECAGHSRKGWNGSSDTGHVEHPECERPPQSGLNGDSCREAAPRERKANRTFNAGWWATEPDVGRVANGIPFRAHRLKGLGNAIVPQLAYEIGQAINQIENQLAL